MSSGQRRGQDGKLYARHMSYLIPPLMSMLLTFFTQVREEGAVNPPFKTLQIQ